MQSDYNLKANEDRQAVQEDDTVDCVPVVPHVGITHSSAYEVRP